VVQEAADVVAAQLARVALVVEEDELFNPAGEALGLRRGEAEAAGGVTDLIEEPGWGGGRRLGHGSLLPAQGNSVCEECTAVQARVQGKSRDGKIVTRDDAA
jgi:hypothetical protein